MFDLYAEPTGVGAPPLGQEPQDRDERRDYNNAIAAARATLGEEEFAKAWSEGKKMILDEAVAYALQEN